MPSSTPTDMVWMNNYIPMFYVDTLIYTFPNLYRNIPFNEFNMIEPKLRKGVFR